MARDSLDSRSRTGSRQRAGRLARSGIYATFGRKSMGSAATDATRPAPERDQLLFSSMTMAYSEAPTAARKALEQLVKRFRWPADDDCD